MTELRRMVHGLPHIRAVDDLREACMVGKQRRMPFPDQAAWRAERALELVSTDRLLRQLRVVIRISFCLLMIRAVLWISTEEGSGGRGDQGLPRITRCGRNLSQATSCQCCAQTGEGSSPPSEYCTTEGVQRQLTAPYSPQQNGVVEHRNAMVIEAARSMMKQKGLPG
jgi:hypothetical protein